MKALFFTRRTAAVVLVIISLLAVPLLGGLKLRSAYGRAYRAFETAGSTVDKYGNSLVSDMEAAVGAAEGVITIAKSLEGGENDVAAAEEAVNAYHGAETVIGRYRAFLNVTAKTRLVYELAADGTEDTALDALYSTVLDRSSIIARGYAAAYREAEDGAAELISGFPASLLAKLYNLGEG